MNFTKQLIIWYLQNKRDLPWRLSRDPYSVWLSEIMLQQTRIAQGLDYFLKFKEVFPTIHDLAQAEEQKVLKLWQGLGYYSRARNLHKTAQYISEELDGKFPNNYKQLMKLKGVGDYTASAIASICYNQPEAVVDGNVYRVLSRYFGINTPINSTKGIKEFKTLAQTVLDRSQPGTYNQAIMDFGAMVCKPKSPHCSSCPLSNSCVAFEKNLIQTLPVKEKKTKIKHRYLHYLIFLTQDRKTKIELRNSKGIWQGLYQFPCVELQNDQEELLNNKAFMDRIPRGAKVTLLNAKEIVHKLSHQHLHTHFWKIETPIYEGADIPISEVKEYPLPILIARFIEQNELI